MKAIIYIEKSDFDKFFTWLNRLKQGNLEPTPVSYFLSNDELERPLQLLLSTEEYSLIQDVEKSIEDIKNEHGNLNIDYKPESLNADKILIGNIIRNASRYDLQVEIMNTAVELAMSMPGLTPLDAFLIAERELVPFPRPEEN